MSTLSVFPNPSSDIFNVKFSVANTTDLSVKITDAQGRTIETIYDHEKFQAGEHSLQYNASKLAPGMYFYEITADHKYVKQLVKL